MSILAYEDRDLYSSEEGLEEGLKMSMNAAVTNCLLACDGTRRLELARRQSVIFSEGEAADALYLVEKGLVKFVRRDEGGREVILSLAGAGRLFGEQAALSGGSWTCDAITLEESVIHRIPASSFREVTQRFPDIWRTVAEMAVRRLEEAERRLELVSLYDVEQRIMRSLLELSRQYGTVNGDSGECCIRLSQSELASLLGATRETTSTALNAMARAGLLELGRRRVTIVSKARLEAAAADHSRARTALGR